MNRWSAVKSAVGPWIVPGVVWLLSGLITVQTGYLYALLAAPQSARDPQFAIALMMCMAAGLVGGIAPTWQVHRALRQGRITRKASLTIAGSYLLVLLVFNCVLEASSVGDVLAPQLMFGLLRLLPLMPLVIPALLLMPLHLPMGLAVVPLMILFARASRTSRGVRTGVLALAGATLLLVLGIARLTDIDEWERRQAASAPSLAPPPATPVQNAATTLRIDGDITWLDHLAMRPTEPELTVSQGSNHTGLGLGQVGLVVNSSTIGDTYANGSNKTIVLEVAGVTSSLSGIQVCSNSSNPRSFVSQIRVAEAQGDGSYLVRLDERIDPTDMSPVCLTINRRFDTHAQPLSVSLRLTFGDVSDQIAILGVALLRAGNDAPR